MTRSISGSRSSKCSADEFRAWKKIVSFSRYPGAWEKMSGFIRYRCENGAILNYWRSTGTMNFQGPKKEVDDFARTLNLFKDRS